MSNSIGLVEIKNISRGILLLDDMLKAARVEVLQSGSICPGKFMIVLGGNLADVNAAVERAKELAEENLIDSFVIGNVSEGIFPAISACAEVREKGALGIIETFTATACIEAADDAAKAANVTLIEVRLARGMGGKSFVTMTGHVADVTAAVETGSRRAAELGMLVNTEVIANPHPDVWNSVL